MIQLVTYDFHNTIAHCDDWFQLEIRTLPARVLEMLDPEAFNRIGEEEVTRRYRALRTAVIESGVEIEAVDGIERVYLELDLELDRKAIEQSVETLMRDALEQAVPVDGVIESIELLSEAGIRLGIVSAAIYHPFLEWTLEKFGIADRFEFVVTTASAGKYKSDPALYSDVIQQAGVKSEHAAHIGDSPKWDIWSPQQSGIATVLVPYGDANNPMLHETDAIPDLTASNAVEAAVWILGKNQPESSDPDLIVDIFTLFPTMFSGVLGESILKRAHAKGLIDIRVHDIRDWTHDKHRTADDTPYGGGAGMVMKAPPIIDAVESVLGDAIEETHIAIMSAGGRRFTQPIAQELSERKRVALICGHYEGIDERVSELLNADELSIGDYVLTGGELPAMVIADTISRLVPGVITEASILDESHLGDDVEYPHYTRPAEYRGLTVPDVLLSGHHAKINEWRAEKARERTKRWRPDLVREVE